MKAVVLRNYGDVDQLQVEEVPTPSPASGEVLVRVFSTSINPIDFKIRQGAMKDRMPLKFPAILGRDLAGEISAVGDGVTKFRVGDKVMGFVNRTYSEYVTAKADELSPIPEGLDAKKAGALPLILITGAQLVEVGIKPKRGDLVLVTGAVGSVGRSAVFVAKQHGAKVIAGVRSNQKSQAQELEADSVVALDSDDEILKLPELDAIADTINGDALGKVLPKLKKGGTLASVVGQPAAATKVGITANTVFAHPDADRLFDLAKDYQQNRLMIPIAKTFPLAEIRQATREAEKGGQGKIAIVMAD